MNLILAFLCGTIVTVMNVFNGQLSAIYGTYIATTIIHLVGLITFILIMFIKRQKISLRNHLSLLYYTGGVIGVFTVIFNVMAVNSIGASLLTALGLLGQMIASIVIEQRGYFGVIQRSISPITCLSIVVVMIGIGVMML